MKEYNFTNVIRWIEVILAVVICLNFAVFYYASRQLNENSLSSVSNRLDTDVKNMSGALSGIYTMMLSEVGYDKDLDKLLVAQEYKTDIDEVAIKSRIKTMISNWSKELPYKTHYVIYYPGNGILIENSDSSIDYDLWHFVKEDVISFIDKGEFESGWNIVSLNQENYIVNIIGNNGRYMLSYISLSEIVKSLETDVYGQDYYIAWADEAGNVYYNQDKLKEDAIPISNKSEDVLKKDWFKQMLYIKNSVNKDFQIVLVIHNYNSVLKTFRLQLMLGIFSIGVAALVLWILRFVNKTVLQPIQAFNSNIENLKSNERYDVATHYRINELGNASKLMSDMVNKIKGLKIDIYEKTLEQQKARMDFLALQIEPHFYLNCLNIIYNMAQMKQFEEIQKLSHYVSEYLRYIFKSRDLHATVKEELEHIQKYLDIQRMRYGDCFEAYISMDEKVLKAKIPPLVLHTFVENSVKYTINWEDEIEVRITGEAEEEVRIRIEDNGDGFDEELLNKLQNKEDISDGRNRIGIMNAISRMKLAFGGEAEIRFYNRLEGGAGVEIRFPRKD